MSTCYKWKGKLVTEEAIVARIKYELQHGDFPMLKSIILNVQNTELDKIDSAHSLAEQHAQDTEKRIKSGEAKELWLGVSPFLDLKHSLSSSSGLPVIKYLAPIYDKNERIKNSIQKIIDKYNITARSASDIIDAYNSTLPDGEDPQKYAATLILEEMIKTEETIADVGEVIHDLCEKVVNLHIATSTFAADSSAFDAALNEAVNKIMTSTDYQDSKGRYHRALLQVLTEKELNVVTPLMLKDKLKEIVSQTEHHIFDGRSSGTQYRTEYSIATDGIIGDIFTEQGTRISGITGRCDLLVVDEQGNVEIIDYKVSSHMYEDWDSAKEYHNDYQLGLYRAILANHGIDPSKIKLKIQPIYFQVGKFNSSAAVENMKDRLSYQSHNVPHLDWENGEFTDNIRQLIQTPIFTGDTTDINLSEDIQADLEKLLGTYRVDVQDSKKLTKEDVSNRIFPVTTSDGSIRYGLFDINKKDYVYRASKEDFTKDGGYIDKMLDTFDKQFSHQIQTLIQQIKDAQNPNNTDPVDLLEASKDGSHLITSALNEVFGRYCNDNYKLVDIPELLDMGIFIFQNMQTANSEIYEVVRVSKDNLRLEPGINGTQTVLGKFLSTNEAARLTEIKPLNADIANVQLIETMAALNLYSDRLGNYRLGRLKIINPMTGLTDPAPNMDQLKLNFNYLCKRGGVKNNFNDSLQTVSIWEMLEMDIHDIMANPRMSDRTKALVADLDFDQNSVRAKIDFIVRTMHRLEEANPRLLGYTDFVSRRTFETPELKLYYVLSLALMYYQNMPIRYDGKLSQFGLHLEEGIRLLGIPFGKEYKRNLNNGERSLGLGQGLDMGTPTSSASSSLSALFQFWDNAFMHIRSKFTKQLNYLNRIGAKYEQRKTSQLQRALLNSTSIWEPLLEREPNTTKRSKLFRVLNPYDTSNSLDADDRLFLKQMLWEWNKYIMPDISDLQMEWHYEDHASEIDALPVVQDWIGSHRYFNVPLKRATTVERVKNIGKVGLMETGKKLWEGLSDEYDPRQLHGSAKQLLAKSTKVTEMYNQYKISLRDRENIIDSEGVYDFEIDLNYIAGDVCMNYWRKKLFEDALIHANAMATVFHFLQETSDADFENELKTLDDETKVALKNENTWPKELDEAAKGISLMKRVNSLLVLSLRPLQFIKEITFGQFTNYSRAWASKGTGQQVSFKNIFKANQYIWGHQIASWIKPFTSDLDLASFTLAQKINQKYGIANQDLNSIVEKASLKRTGISGGIMKYLFASSSCPDFFNRMTLFVGKMIEDGCFDAHDIDPETHDLVYDIKKDKRFAKLVKYGLDYQTTDEEYLDQKALYKAMLLEFSQAGYTKENGDPLSLEDSEIWLPQAYTPKQKRSMKELSDLAYGFYDHEAKSLNDHKFVGLIFKQFMAFWTAKTQLWLRAPGSNTAQGLYVFKKAYNPETGKDEFVYKEIIEDPETGEITWVETFDSAGGTREKVSEWQGEYVEGLMYSIGYLIKDLFTWNWSDIVGNPQRIGNLKLALHDILIGLIMYNILRMIFSGGTGKMSDIHPAERALVKAMQDTGPQAIFGLSLTPSFVSTFERIKQDLPTLFTEDTDKRQILEHTIGSIKDITWSLKF